MAFTNTKGRYASFGIVTSLPDEVIDTFWYIIDNFVNSCYFPGIIRGESILYEGWEVPEWSREWE